MVVRFSLHDMEEMRRFLDTLPLNDILVTRVDAQSKDGSGGTLIGRRVVPGMVLEVRDADAGRSAMPNSSSGA